MNCMKCGRETAADEVFCSRCLAEMEEYPVRPGTVVRLPRRREEPAGKKTHPRRKPQLSSEEQVKGLKKVVRRLVVVVILLSFLLGVTGYYAVAHLLESQTVFLPGQNYSSVTASEPSETE